MGEQEQVLSGLELSEAAEETAAGGAELYETVEGTGDEREAADEPEQAVSGEAAEDAAAEESIADADAEEAEAEDEDEDA
ncbi:50S ribosomal protein L24 [Paenibacillus darwinianus]|uniref:50S ribosomal protein L24 n=1 Tax=Paenibacillus darwinianus TaxID=1380763 RepID=A0A9W5RZ74_9BACL|nr:hypothetical protein [Paenibacillus darwinianus]EXX84603.1 50S ribosomal protein L24 [Paenibacillus darwinianus]EXX84635.1 50S ribosomal protein L24 [Paenibacillus darwinianus]EXX85377.1 50S ribosomal protein L24 [Paenibacillus darwinianus]